jgi:hypothetical protein
LVRGDAVRSSLDIVGSSSFEPKRSIVYKGLLGGMIDYATTVGGILVATLVPGYIALYLIPSLKNVPVRYLAAAAVGLTLWFFFDTMGDASQLDVNEAVYPIDQFGGYIHFAVIITFVAGIVTLAIFDHFAVPKPLPSATSSATVGSESLRGLVLIPIAVAAVMGIHGLGEGWDFAATASQATTQSLVDAFGTFAALVSYPIHKFLEATIVGIVYTIYVGKNPSLRQKWHIPVIGILFGLTSVIGASIGYYVSGDTTYFFAFGVTSTIYALLRLVGPIFTRFSASIKSELYLGPKVFLAVAVGFFIFYFAALLH